MESRKIVFQTFIVKIVTYVALLMEMLILYLLRKNILGIGLILYVFYPFENKLTEKVYNKKNQISNIILKEISAITDNCIYVVMTIPYAYFLDYGLFMTIMFIFYLIMLIYKKKEQYKVKYENNNVLSRNLIILSVIVSSIVATIIYYIKDIYTYKSYIFYIIVALSVIMYNCIEKILINKYGNS